nr:reverse transcriptase domain-containing protein [Tanacetum cinerariifolium]
NSVNRLDVIDIACEEFVQDVLDFQYNSKSNNPTLVSNPSISENDFCYKPAVQRRRKVNPKIHDVIKKEVIKLLDAGMIHPIFDSAWVSPIHCVHKKGGMTVVANENNELILTRLVTGYFQIPIDPQDQEKTTFTCPYGTFAYRRMPFGLCNAPGRSKGTNLVLNWEKCHFMCRVEIVLGHKISKYGIEVDRAKVDVIAKLPHPTTVKGVRSFLGHVGSENLAADHLSSLENPHKDVLENKDINENFSLETLRSLSSDSTPWKEAIDILKACHEGSTRGHHGTNLKVKKVFDAGFFWPIIYEDAHDMIKSHDTCQRVMIKYEVTHRLATAYHPQTSGQVEVSNRGLKHILERKVRENRASWSDKLDDALWSFCTAFKTPIGCTIYKLVYGKSCHLPIELEHRAYWALKHVNFDFKTAGDHRKLQLNELNELRDQANENFVIYKERKKKLHDSKIKNRIFNVGDQVLFFNSRLKIFSGKLKTRWSGPFTITQVFPYGTIKLSQPYGPHFKVNGHRVKHYFGGDIPSKVVLDLHAFPMDK